MEEKDINLSSAIQRNVGLQSTLKISDRNAGEEGNNRLHASWACSLLLDADQPLSEGVFRQLGIASHVRGILRRHNRHRAEPFSGVNGGDWRLTIREISPIIEFRRLDCYYFVVVYCRFWRASRQDHHQDYDPDQFKSQLKSTFCQRFALEM